MGKKISCAILGYGFSGATLHHPILNSLTEYSVKTILSSKSGQGFTSDFSAIVSDPEIDLVIITTPNETHFKFASESLRHGKHVVLEKPSVLNTSEFDRLTAEAEKQKKVLSVFQNRRWDSDFLTIRKLIAEGTLGEIRYFESHFDRFRPVVQKRWREDKVAGAGLVYDVAPHLVDQALVLFGRPDWIQADVELQRPGANVDDYFKMTFGYGPLRVVLHSDMLTAHSAFRFLVQGTKGTYIKTGFDSQESLLRKKLGPSAAEWGIENENTFGTFYSDSEKRTVPSEKGSYELYYRRLAKQILSGGPAPVELNLARDTIEIIEKALAKKGPGNVFTL